MLDLATLNFSSTVSRGAFMAVFAILVLREHDKAYLRHWLGAALASLLGAMVLTHEPTNLTLPILPSMQIFFLYMLSMALSWSGLKRFYGLDLRFWPIVAMVLLTISPALACLLVYSHGLSSNIVLTIYFLCATTASGVIVFEILMARREDLWSQIVVAVAFSSYALSFLLGACLLVFTQMQPSMETARISVIIDQINITLVYVGYIAMSGERANLKLRRQADTDPLTGLFNRRGIQRILHDSRYFGSQDKTTSIVIGDLDHFKTVNDTLGHEGGDVVLTTFAGCLKSVLRRSDLAVRWGGEEFLMVLANTDLDEAKKFAERLREMTERHDFQICGDQISVTISIGIAEVNPESESINETIQRADKALYRAKREGRNRVCY
ncbi:GGDEF domain-containing protein [Kushneria konosiri]|uniref:diguanylate cyclase n=1 Tax=Kushneria konosiri TaxID=698828 RepID=A0A2Z2H9M0_9GAMM|nr:GGDEF domain-containing protein [Kushneria konosiri]ARS54058.1 hypothetical protein B9G99_15205 [Kushneria konosiri]